MVRLFLCGDKENQMKITQITFLVSGLLVASYAFAANEKIANVFDGSGKNIGQVKISEDPKGVRLVLDLKGAKPGVHAMHFHNAGKCAGPDFKSAGDHFNPTHKQHGKKNPQGPHLGDLPNVNISKEGELKETVVVEGATLMPQALHTLATSDGTSLVIHAAADDYKTDPSGNSGDRIYCAVIVEPKAMPEP
jgi:Cu-Zn family superoxide dismutase